MKIERRRPPKKINTLALAIGCLSGIGIMGLVAILVLLLVIIPAISDTAVQSLGFERIGDTDSLFDNAAQSRPLLDSIQSEPASVVIQAGSYQQTVSNVETYDVQVGTMDGQTTLQMTFSEQDLIGLCQQYSDVCAATGDQIRNIRFDLRPGGMIVYGDVHIEQINIWQTVGVVMRLTGDNRLAVSGVDVNGQLYAAPPNEIGETINEIERVANELLRQLTVQAGIETYTLDSIYIDDAAIVITMR